MDTTLHTAMTVEAIREVCLVPLGVNAQIADHLAANYT
jgi:hypothetical protein